MCFTQLRVPCEGFGAGSPGGSGTMSALGNYRLSPCELCDAIKPRRVISTFQYFSVTVHQTASSVFEKKLSALLPMSNYFLAVNKLPHPPLNLKKLIQENLGMLI